MSFVVDIIAMVFGMPRALFPQMAHESFGGPVEGGTTMALLAAAISVGAVGGGVFSGLAAPHPDARVSRWWSPSSWGVAITGFRRRGRTGRRPQWCHAVGLRWTAWQSGGAGRHGVGGVPVHDPAGGGIRRPPRPAAGECSSSSSAADRAWPTRCNAAGAALGTTVAAAGGGLLVVAGVLLAVLAAPAFLRYRPDTGNHNQHVS